MFCRIYKWCIEREMDDHRQVKNLRILRHLEVCHSCQDWLQSLEQIDRHLQTDLPCKSDMHIKQVHAAIHQHLEKAAEGLIAPINHKMYKFYRIRYSIAAAAVLLVALALLSLYLQKSDNSHHDRTVSSVLQLSGQIQYQIPALADLPEDILESKLQDMEVDVRNAIGFIKNCLSLSPLATNITSENIDS